MRRQRLPRPFGYRHLVAPAKSAALEPLEINRCDSTGLLALIGGPRKRDVLTVARLPFLDAKSRQTQ